MRVRWGSWRDPNVARDLKALAVVGGAVLVVISADPGLALFVGPVVVGALVALFMAGRGGARSTPGDGSAEAPHPGYNVSRVAIAGFPGLVLVVGFVWMFWFGAPMMRPLVVCMAIVGVLAGLGLIGIERWHKVPSPTILGLSSQIRDKGKGAVGAAEQPDAADKARMV